MTLVLVALIALAFGFFCGVYLGFESATKDIGRFGFFTWGGKKYDCTTAETEAKP